MNAARIQERDRVSNASEGATKLSLKKQELLAKEEELSSLITPRRAKLNALLTTTDAGTASSPLSTPYANGAPCGQTSDIHGSPDIGRVLSDSIFASLPRAGA